MSNPLYWDTPYEIVLALDELYAGLDLEALSRDDLLDMIVRLPHFVDDPVLANDKILDDLLREWYEERGKEWN